MADINEFIAIVKNEGLARTNRFVVYITPPARLVGVANNTKLRFLCESASIPGMNFLSNPVMTYGEQREVIYNRSFEPVNLEFMLDQDMEIKRFFDSWQNLIINPRTRMLSYYENYIGTVEIYQLDNSGKESSRYIVRLNEAFPKSVAPISYSYGNKDITKLSVAIEYKFWVPLTTANKGGTTGQMQVSPQPSFKKMGIDTGGLSGQNSSDIPSGGNNDTPV
jgi:hypothetical protein